jgi:hypothetical protein
MVTLGKIQYKTQSNVTVGDKITVQRKRYVREHTKHGMVAANPSDAKAAAARFQDDKKS